VPAGMTAPCRHNIPQRLPGAKLRIEHDAELRPAGKIADTPISIITTYNLLKPVARYNLEQLMKNRVSVLHGLNSPGCRFAVSSTINLSYPLGIQTFFTIPIPLTGQQCSYCYKDGEFFMKSEIDTPQKMQEMCIKMMKKKGMNGIMAWLMTRGIPRLERWNN
jgi:hypothetical protein